MKRYVVGFEKTVPIIDDDASIIGTNTTMEELDFDDVEELIDITNEMLGKGYLLTYIMARKLTAEELFDWVASIDTSEKITAEDKDYVYYLIDYYIKGELV